MWEGNCGKVRWEGEYGKVEYGKVEYGKVIVGR